METETQQQGKDLKESEERRVRVTVEGTGRVVTNAVHGPDALMLVKYGTGRLLVRLGDNVQVEDLEPPRTYCPCGMSGCSDPAPAGPLYVGEYRDAMLRPVP